VIGSGSEGKTRIFQSSRWEAEGKESPRRSVVVAIVLGKPFFLTYKTKSQSGKGKRMGAWGKEKTIRTASLVGCLLPPKVVLNV
jgi:hypothetical protein